MQDALTAYSAFYKKKHPKHKLSWVHYLGHATLRGRFAPGDKTLSVSLHQTLVLLLFNQADKLSYDEIQKQLLLFSYPDDWKPEQIQAQKALGGYLFIDLNCFALINSI